jgi:hypothetical protein
MSHGARILMAGTLGLLLSGCGELVDMGRNRDVDPRRVYVNDAAANDSLPSTFVKEGLLFVLQPGKSYRLRLKTPVATDSMVLYIRGSGGTFTPFQTLGSTAQSANLRIFSLQAPTNKTTADYYLAFLRGGGGGPATMPDSVRLVPVDTVQADTIAVRLLMVRQLTSPVSSGYMNDAAKALYARNFHNELRSIYAAYGVTVDTSTVIVETSGEPLTVTFDGSSFPIPGTRRQNAVNIYLVDSIRSEGSQGMILGFAPREAIDLATNPESRVVLNVRGGSAVEMAVTAAHEIGHFLGLRHTTATLQDRGFDRDESNRDDGFRSTPYCAILEKPSVQSPAREIVVQGPGGAAYCLRVAGVSATCNCPDVGNLMYPYGCNPAGQKALGADQRVFMRNNLRLYR